jgi:hypothetical protein
MMCTLVDIIASGSHQNKVQVKKTINCFGEDQHPDCVGEEQHPNCVGEEQRPDCVGEEQRPDCVGDR